MFGQTYIFFIKIITIHNAIPRNRKITQQVTAPDTKSYAVLRFAKLSSLLVLVSSDDVPSYLGDIVQDEGARQ